VLFVFTRLKEDCTANARQPISVKETKAKIRKLQQERVEVLNQALDVALTLYREGALDIGRVHSVQQDLLAAQLEMVETREAQIDVLTSQLKIAKRSLAVAEEMFQAGAATVLDVHQARSAMLDIEIRLLRRRVIDKSKQPR
jgi:outer membrane protein TolC